MQAAAAAAQLAAQKSKRERERREEEDDDEHEMSSKLTLILLTKRFSLVSPFLMSIPSRKQHRSTELILGGLKFLRSLELKLKFSFYVSSLNRHRSLSFLSHLLRADEAARSLSRSSRKSFVCLLCS